MPHHDLPLSAHPDTVDLADALDLFSGALCKFRLAGGFTPICTSPVAVGESFCFEHGGLPVDDAPAMMRSDALECAPDVNSFSRAHHPRRCAATTRRGHPCRMFALQGEGRCLNHFGAVDTVAGSRRAAEASAVSRRRPSEDLLHTVFSLTDRASIQALLDTTLRLVLSGRISNARAALTFRGAAIALRNFDRTVDSITGPKPQQHEWFDYFDKVKSLLTTIDPLLDEAAQHDPPPPEDDFPA